MKIKVSHAQDFWTGVLFLTVAAFFMITGWDVVAGAAARMGPGYFPRTVAAILGTLGLILLGKGVTRVGEPLGYWGARGLLSILGSILTFGVLLPVLGLLCTGTVTMFIAFLATPQVRWAEAFVVSILLPAVCTLLFVFGLGLTFPVWPQFLGL